MRPSREQVQAWLSTVLGPMVDALRVEEEQLAEGNPSLHVYAHSIDFEFLWGSAHMTARPYLPNQEQFFRASAAPLD
jgi:hypothetical protein